MKIFAILNSKSNGRYLRSGGKGYLRLLERQVRGQGDVVATKTATEISVEKLATALIHRKGQAGLT